MGDDTAYCLSRIVVARGILWAEVGMFSLNLSANSVMSGRLDARRTLKALVRI